MATLICSFFFLGCLAFFWFMQYTLQFEGLIFRVNLVCVGLLYDWEYLGGALFPFCPVRQPDYFCLTYTNDCNSPPHTYSDSLHIPTSIHMHAITLNHWALWTLKFTWNQDVKGFLTTELQLSTSSRIFTHTLFCIFTAVTADFTSIFFTLLINVGVMLLFLFLLENRVLSLSAVWGISGAAG